MLKNRNETKSVNTAQNARSLQPGDTFNPTRFIVRYSDNASSTSLNLFNQLELHLVASEITEDETVIMNTIILQFRNLHKWDDLEIDSLFQKTLMQKERCQRLFRKVRAHG